MTAHRECQIRTQKVSPKKKKSPKSSLWAELPTLEVKPIGVIYTDFKEKFGIPRQPGLCPDTRGVIELLPDARLARASAELEQFSHIWILFWFHDTGRGEGQVSRMDNWLPTVRPPRLGGAKKMGVLASRSPHRPNSIGMSAVKLERIEREGNKVRISTSGVDIVNGTPVLDIKPYLSYTDLIKDTDSGWAIGGFDEVCVGWSDGASAQFETLCAIEGLDLNEASRRRRVISQVLTQDPRPSSQRRKYPVRDTASQSRRFGIALFDWDIRFEIRDAGFWILEVIELE